MKRIGMILAIASVACSSAKGRVKMGELNAVLANATGLDGDPLDKTPVEYEQTGKPEYDQFFLDAAKTQAGMVVSNALVEALTKNVKAFAMSYAAANATDDAVKQLTNGHAPDQLTAEEAIAVLKLQKSRSALSDDESKFALRTGANTVQTALYLKESAASTKDLADKGQQLSSRVKTDFTGLDASKAPGVASALTSSVNNLTQAATTMPEVAKQLARLGEGLASL